MRGRQISIPHLMRDLSMNACIYEFSIGLRAFNDSIGVGASVLFSSIYPLGCSGWTSAKGAWGHTE